MNSYVEGYEEWRGDFPTRYTGSIVADRAGAGVAYALFNLEPRGVLFVEPGDPVYEGMIVGEHNRDNDIDVNATKEKKLTNLRASGKDENVILTPVKKMTLEHALHFVREDEVVEVTPLSIRLRKNELSAMPEIKRCRTVFSQLERQWTWIALTGKINCNAIAATLFDFIFTTRDTFGRLRLDMVFPLVEGLGQAGRPWPVTANAARQACRRTVGPLRPVMQSLAKRRFFASDSCERFLISAWAQGRLVSCHRRCRRAAGITAVPVAGRAAPRRARAFIRRR